MIKQELKDILVTRIGWKDDKTVAGFTLDATNLQKDSDRVFQAEHSAVTLRNIRDCQPIVNISEADFNTYLTEKKEEVVLQVLSDALERDYVDDTLIERYPSAFDDAISLRMVIAISELIMSSTRSNKTERFGDKFVAKLNYDIYRESPNKFAIREKTFTFSMGISTRYGFAIDSLQRRFGDQRNRLKTITAGQAFRYDISELRDFDRDWN